MHQVVAEAIRRVAPYAGRFAYLAASRLAAFIAVAVVHSLRRHGVRVPAGVEHLAAAAASYAAAHGVHPVAAAARALRDEAGISVALKWNPDSQHPIGVKPYTPSAPASSPIPPPVIEPPIGTQMTLLGRAAAGTVSSDMVMPTFPPMYQ